jgi:hypothetical protein
MKMECYTQYAAMEKEGKLSDIGKYIQIRSKILIVPCFLKLILKIYLNPMIWDGIPRIWDSNFKFLWSIFLLN